MYLYQYLDVVSATVHVAAASTRRWTDLCAAPAASVHAGIHTGEKLDAVIVIVHMVMCFMVVKSYLLNVKSVLIDQVKIWKKIFERKHNPRAEFSTSELKTIDYL